MRFTPLETFAARSRRTAACPACGSLNVRASRRSSDGFLTSLLDLRPIKCVDCRAYFALPRAVGLPESALDAEPPRVPFQPSAAPAGGNFFDRRRGCPACGSASIRAVDHGVHEAWVLRLSVSVDFRCSSCNASFRRFAPLRGLVAFALASIVLTLLTYGAFWLVRHAPFSKSGAPSMMRKDTAPRPSPPVFHRMRADSRLRGE